MLNKRGLLGAGLVLVVLAGTPGAFALESGDGVTTGKPGICAKSIRGVAKVCSEVAKVATVTAITFAGVSAFVASAEVGKNYEKKLEKKSINEDEWFMAKVAITFARGSAFASFLGTPYALYRCFKNFG